MWHIKGIEEEDREEGWKIQCPTENRLRSVHSVYNSSGRMKMKNQLTFFVGVVKMVFSTREQFKRKNTISFEFNSVPKSGWKWATKMVQQMLQKMYSVNKLEIRNDSLVTTTVHKFLIIKISQKTQVVYT